jgi:integrase
MGRRRYQHPNVLKTDAKRPQWYYRIMIDVLVDRNRIGRREKAVYLGYCDEMGKREAEKLRDLKLKDVNNTPALIQSQVRFSDLLAVYRSTYLMGLKPSTSHNFEHRLKKYVEPTFGPLRLYEVDAIKVQQWVYQMENSGLSKSTRQTNLAMLRSVFEAADMWGYTVTRNPCKRIKLGAGGEIRARRPLEPWEAKLLLAALDEEPLKLIVETALYTGLRISEVLGITWSAIDVRRRVVQVRQAKSQQGALAEPKTPLGRRAQPIEFLADRFQRPEAAKDADLIWPDEMYHSLQGKLIVRAKRAGIEFPGFGFHTLRRTYATLRMMLGFIAPPKELQRDMGHASEAMTARYIRQSEAGLVERMRNLIETSGDPREQDVASHVVSIDYKAAG